MDDCFGVYGGKCVKRAIGFTITELLMVIFIISSVLIAVAPINSWLQRQGVKLATEQLRGELQLARLMAINHKKTCSIVFNSPSMDNYSNNLNHRAVNLESYRGGVHFLPKGPDGGVASKSITFNRRGMATSFGAVFLSNLKGSDIFRVRVLTPGGISVYRWNGNDWR